tara:strand:+ start:35709 stop:37070 length:1362 start_codon:yes stop_codon:yes gene_type:complete
MKKHFQISIFACICLLTFESAFAQENTSETTEECRTKISLFYEYAKVGDYDNSYEPWLWCLDNCPDGSKNIYILGLKIAEDRYAKVTGDQKEAASQLIDKVYTQRIKYYPDNLGKVYSDWAISLEERGAKKEQVFEKLELAFKTDPAQMSIKNLAKYFQEITDRNKDTEVQKVFDIYDDAIDAVNMKIDYHSKALEKLTADTQLSSKEKTELKNHEINLRGLGQVEGILDNIISGIATCEKLIPLYTKNLEAKTNDAKWLKRAVSRLYYKECTEDPIYHKLVEAYVKADPSPEASIFYAGILLKAGKQTEGIKNINNAVEQETDSYKKADYLYKIAGIMRNNGRKTESRDYAIKALKFRPSMGKAYLLIANLYASSANACGTDEFSKRMTYVAAANKAKQAKAADPSISNLADQHIKSYTASAPATKDVFLAGLKSGDPFTVKCWINETVKIP